MKLMHEMAWLQNLYINRFELIFFSGLDCYSLEPGPRFLCSRVKLRQTTHFFGLCSWTWENLVLNLDLDSRDALSLLWYFQLLFFAQLFEFWRQKVCCLFTFCFISLPRYALNLCLWHQTKNFPKYCTFYHPEACTVAFHY